MDSRHGPRTRSVPDDEDRVVGQRPTRVFTLSAEEDPHVSVRRHREMVVLRLLDRGLSVELLMRLIPEWQPMICSIAERASTHRASPVHGANGSTPSG